MDAWNHFRSSLDNYLDSAGHEWGNKHLPGAPWEPMAIVATYLVLVLKVGPTFMRNRKAMQLERLMRLYNVINIAVNAIFLAMVLYYTKFGYQCWQCIELEHMPVPTFPMMCAVYGYQYLKIFDLLDTMFFVLRKKNRQITMLHLVHHSVMPFTSYFGVKLAPYSPTLLIGVLNEFVHVLMYTYYYLASFGSEMQPFLWWKKYLTLIQLAQFAILVSHAITFLFFRPDCPYSKAISTMQLMEGSYFLYAFGKFYVKSYLYTKPSKAE